ncbi:MAG: c-type cytochrome biogenesis protein CcmI [Gemmatimonadetes bacterium]|nr:c-type cytochrome biogenesis protein CcmI [Gemmatimonadota bacterium]
MTLMLGALLVTAAVVIYVLYPIITGAQAPLERLDDEPTEAEMRKTVALKALRDVEYERAMGKLDDGDYEFLKAELSSEALAALQAEEEATGAGGSSAAGLEGEIVAARARLRSGPICDACGEANETGSRFCAQCGRPLGGPAD